MEVRLPFYAVEDWNLIMKKTMPEVSQSSNDRPEPHWLGTVFLMICFLVVMVKAFRHDAALKKLSENDQQGTLPP
jgi:hypothetical protein